MIIKSHTVLSYKHEDFFPETELNRMPPVKIEFFLNSSVEYFMAQYASLLSIDFHQTYPYSKLENSIPVVTLKLSETQQVNIVSLNNIV